MVAKDDNKELVGPVYASNDIPYNYIVVIDAGSSGSRVHIYNYPSQKDKTNNDTPFPHVSKLGNKWAKKIKPGISSFADEPDKVGKKHIKKLLEYAKDVVPKEQQKRTPIFLHATAGMRLLEDAQVAKILENSCKYIQKKSKFFLPDCKTQLSVIDGETEGIFGWLGLNYLIGGIDDPDKHDHGKNHSTYGFMDMGGASTQITFVPNTTEIEENHDKLYKVHLQSWNGDDNSQDYELYSKTFLRMGVNEARKKYDESLKSDKDKIEDPCHLKGYEKDNIVGTGNYEECSKALKPLIEDIKKEDKPDFDFEINHFVGVSEYWDSSEAFNLGGDLDYSKLTSEVSTFCSQDWAQVKGNESSGYSDLSEKELESLCFKSSWLLNVINEGFEFPKEPVEYEENSLSEYLKPLQAAEKVNEVEFSWTLGRALLYAASETGEGDNTNTGLKSPGDSKIVAFGAASNPRPDFKHENDDDDDDDDWDLDDILEKHSHRLWGSILFLFILLIIVWLMLGKVRRRQIWESVKGKITRRQGNRSQRQQPYEQLNRQAAAAEEFELGDVEDQFSVEGSDDEEEVRV